MSIGLTSAPNFARWNLAGDKVQLLLSQVSQVGMGLYLMTRVLTLNTGPASQLSPNTRLRETSRPRDPASHATSTAWVTPDLRHNFCVSSRICKLLLSILHQEVIYFQSVVIDRFLNVIDSM